MGVIRAKLVKRAAAKGSQGEALSLIKGDEPLEELKEIVIRLAHQCPLGKAHFQCPFRILSGLTHSSIVYTVQSLPRESCLQLFEMEHECRRIYATERLPS